MLTNQRLEEEMANSPSDLHQEQLRRQMRIYRINCGKRTLSVEDYAEALGIHGAGIDNIARIYKEPEFSN